MTQQQGDGMESVGNQDDMISTEYEERVLQIHLTDRERLELGENIANNMRTIELKEMELQAKRDAIKADISKAQESVHDDAHTIRLGKREGKVHCAITSNFRIGEVKVRRMDTDEVIERRPMTSAERQMGLHL